MKQRRELGQFFTPEWVAQALVERYYPDLGMCDRLVEPSCGDGAFLRVLPDHVQVVGVEIDPDMAERARQCSGRPVVVGDFATAELPFSPTLVLGNPPFRQQTIQQFLDRAWELLPDEGGVGFILPAFAFQTSSTVDRLAQRWHMQQDMLPRNVFPRLMAPLCFARLTKGRKRGLVGFALYHEAAAVARLQARYRALLAQGERSVWAAVTRAAMEALGGTATLPQIYREVEGSRPTTNRYWQEKVRQTLQRIAYRTAPGTWAIRQAA
jgi:site-specific DNA-methyltransferase (adenine-specific)